MATIQDIKQRAQQVKDATQIGENTANRVGGVLVDMADHLEQDENQLSSLYPADAVPTAGSTKPVQSGSVHEQLSQLLPMDAVPTPNSVKPVQSGGVVKDMFLMEFVGRGGTFVENQDTCINWIKGHTYRVYPYVTEWAWGISTSSSKVFQLGYVKTDNTRVLVADVPRGTATPNIKSYYDITLPDDGSVKSFLIGGRAASGYVVKCVVVDITYTNSVSDALIDNIDTIDDELKELSGEKNYIEGKSLTTAGVLTNNANRFVSDPIPVNSGDSVVWQYSNVRLTIYICFYTENGTCLGYRNGGNGVGVLSFTCPTYETGTIAYLRATFEANNNDYTPSVKINNQNVWKKVENGRVAELEDKVAQLSPSVTDKGLIGQMYPEEVLMIEGALNNRLTNRFHFIHLSDNHNTTFASAPEYLDLCPADFIVNTGDLVKDKFSDSVATTMAEATAPTKPVYLCLGNHDVFRATSQQDIFDKFVAPTNAHNGTSFTKSYYSVDITKGSNVFKCIFLNNYDGFTSEELGSASMSTIIGGKMTSEQVVWFIQELQDAATNGKTVVLFAHTVPTYYDTDTTIDKWADRKNVNKTESVSRNLTYLLDIVDAFIAGTSYEYSGTTYNFSAVGKFVAWFAGHTHYDMLGRVNGHPNQWAVNVCRPNNAGGSADNADDPMITWNYVTIDVNLTSSTSVRSLSIYRVGQQQTVFGVKRDVVRVFY